MPGTTGPPAPASGSLHTATTETRLQFVKLSVTFPPIDPDQHEIRLLHIRRCSTKQNIVCQLSVVSLDNAPKYDALSYVWGTMDDPATIAVNGLEFRITRNLHIILANMIPSDNSTRPFWIDAICINQGSEPESLEERRHQVNLMQQIYTNAASVTAYLGDPFPGLKLVMNYLFLAGTEPARHVDLNRFPRFAVSGKAARRSGDLAPALGRLFNLPWWNRIWTVQEYVLAREVVFQIGHFRYPADVISEGVQSLMWHEQRNRCCEFDFFDVDQRVSLWTGINKLDRMNDIRRSSSHAAQIPFTRGLAFFNDRKCNDPRDKIYALLGLFHGIGDVIEPDYRKTTEDLFQEVALAWTRKERNLRFLSAISRPHKRRGLPTWAVDWSLWPYPSLDTGSIIRQRSDTQTYLFDACLGSNPSWELNSPGIVTANGFIFDTITAGITHDFEWLGSICGIALTACSTYGSPKQAHQALLRTLVGDVMTSGIHWVRYKEERSFEFHCRLKAWFEETFYNGVLKAEIKSSGPHREVTTIVTNASLERSFISTYRGYIGLANQETRAGDVVAILGGGKVPIILRPASTIPEGQSLLKTADQLSFQVVGDAYVHGIMDGEALQICGKHKNDLGQLILV